MVDNVKQGITIEEVIREFEGLDQPQYVCLSAIPSRGKHHTLKVITNQSAKNARIFLKEALKGFEAPHGEG